MMIPRESESPSILHELMGGVRGVHGNDNGPDPDNGHIRDYKLRNVGQHDDHTIIPLDAGIVESTSQRISKTKEFRVGYSSFMILECNLVGSDPIMNMEPRIDVHTSLHECGCHLP